MAQGVSLKKVVIDALKPREIDILDLSKAICLHNGIDNVSISVIEMDVKTETIKITVTGDDIDLNEIKKIVERYSTAIRSIDEISVAKQNHRH